MAQQIPASGATLFQTPISNGTVPAEGPNALGVSAPFATAGVSEFNFNALLTERQAYMRSIQSVFVDNSLNNAIVQLKSQKLGQGPKIPPLSQAYVPLCVGPQDVIVITCTGATADVGLIFANVPLPAAVWAV